MVDQVIIPEGSFLVRINCERFTGDEVISAPNCRIDFYGKNRWNNVINTATITGVKQLTLVKGTPPHQEVKGVHINCETFNPADFNIYAISGTKCKLTGVVETNEVIPELVLFDAEKEAASAKMWNEALQQWYEEEGSDHPWF